MIAEGMDVNNFAKEKSLLGRLKEVVEKEEFFWRQKSREVWLKASDGNMKFFHNSTKERIEVNRISSIKGSNGRMVDDLVEIRNKTVDFFQTLLNDYEGSNLWAQNEMLRNIPRVVTKDQNKLIFRKFTEGEIRVALFQLHPEKGSGAQWFCCSVLSKNLGYCGA